MGLDADIINRELCVTGGETMTRWLWKKHFRVEDCGSIWPSTGMEQSQRYALKMVTSSGELSWLRWTKVPSVGQ